MGDFFFILFFLTVNTLKKCVLSRRQREIMACECRFFENKLAKCNSELTFCPKSMILSFVVVVIGLT